MRCGEDIYRRICRARNLDEAVRALTTEDLVAVAEYLAGVGADGGIPAQVMGMVSARLNQAATRKPKRRRKIA
jgi:hypothetical protein